MHAQKHLNMILLGISKRSLRTPFFLHLTTTVLFHNNQKRERLHNSYQLYRSSCLDSVQVVVFVIVIILFRSKDRFWLKTLLYCLEVVNTIVSTRKHHSYDLKTICLRHANITFDVYSQRLCFFEIVGSFTNFSWIINGYVDFYL